MSDEITSLCQICHTPDVKSTHGPPIDGDYFECHRCGKYTISRSLSVSLAKDHEYNNSPTMMAKVSHAINKMQRENRNPLLETTLFRSLLEQNLPTLSGQLNNLILWVGKDTIYGESKVYLNSSLLSVIGAIDVNGLSLVIRTLERYSYINIIEYGEHHELSLTYEGWLYRLELLQGGAESKKAFIAMQYNDKEMDKFVNTYLRAAVTETGFELVRLDDSQQAGLIDDQLRVDIQTSRFVIADLTHNNNGAYWEAGYAEGLGKPVIYTCKKLVFEKLSTHFDTNHHLTVLWDTDNPDEFTQKLKATIRATLPDEAILED